MKNPIVFLPFLLLACSVPDAKPAASAEGSSLPAASAVQSVSASAPNPTTRPHAWLQPAALVGNWQHAFEKNGEGLETFVSAGETLPVARFRKAFELADGGKASVLCLSPSDAHERRDGTWQLDRDVLRIEVQCFGPEPDVIQYSVERASGGELALRPLP